MSDRIVIVGPKPKAADSAVGGVTAGFNSLIQALEARQLTFSLVNSVFGGECRKTGEFSIKRAFASIWIVLNAYIQLVGSKRLYMTLSTSKGGFLRGAVIILWAWVLRVRIVLHLHGGGFREFYEAQGTMMKSFVRFVMAKSDCVIALGELLVEQFSAVPDYKDRVVVIPNGFPANMEVPDPCLRVRERNESFQILYLSNLVPSKGLTYLMEAVQTLLKESLNLKLEIAGNLLDVADGLDVEFETYCDNFNSLLSKLGECAHYHGIVYGNEKETLFRNSHVFCLPTFYPWEGQPISIIEALAYGLPVISTPHKGIPEEVIDGYNGFLVEPKSSEAIASALRVLYQNGAKYKTFSIAARRHFDDNFRREVHQERLVNCILGKSI